jgi:hypothetical protein
MDQLIKVIHKETGVIKQFAPIITENAIRMKTLGYEIFPEPKKFEDKKVETLEEAIENSKGETVEPDKSAKTKKTK